MGAWKGDVTTRSIAHKSCFWLAGTRRVKGGQASSSTVLYGDFIQVAVVGWNGTPSLALLPCSCGSSRMRGAKSPAEWVGGR